MCVQVESTTYYTKYASYIANSYARPDSFSSALVFNVCMHKVMKTTISLAVTSQKLILQFVIKTKIILCKA